MPTFNSLLVDSHSLLHLTREDTNIREMKVGNITQVVTFDFIIHLSQIRILELEIDSRRKLKDVNRTRVPCTYLTHYVIMCYGAMCVKL